MINYARSELIIRREYFLMFMTLILLFITNIENLKEIRMQIFFNLFQL